MTTSQTPGANIRGSTAGEIIDSVENMVIGGELQPGDRLPSMRRLAGELGVHPNTVGSAFKALQQRGIVVTDGRRGTSISPRPPVRTPSVGRRAAHLRDLSSGNPDPALLPTVTVAEMGTVLYGDNPHDDDLIEWSRASFRADSVPNDHLSVTSGALDALHRVMLTSIRLGDRVAVEDPGYPAVHDLLRSVGAQLVPMPIDAEGPTPHGLAGVLASGVEAFVYTPRCQNPTGAVLSLNRAKELRSVLSRHATPVLAVADDHAFGITQEPLVTLSESSDRWIVIRSLNKSLGPDLRLAVATGDERTISRLEGNIAITSSWVSHILQRTVAAALRDTGVRGEVDDARKTYDRRRTELLRRLESAGIDATGRSGFNIWIPVDDESDAAARCRDAGLGVQEGKRFRLDSQPGIRVTISTLADGDAELLAAALSPPESVVGRRFT